MKVKISGKEFHNLIDGMNFLPYRRWSIDLDNSVRLEVLDDTIYVGRTDGITHARMNAPVDCKRAVAGDFLICAPWNRIRAIANNVKHADELVMEVKSSATGPVLCIFDGELNIAIGSKNASDHIGDMSFYSKKAVEYELSIPAIKEVSAFSSKDEHRPILTAVYYKDGSYAASDSYRLGVVDFPGDSLPGEFLLSPTFVKLAVKYFHDNVTCHIDNKCIWLAKDGIQIFSRLIEGQFPSFRSFIPDSSNKSSKLKFQEGFIETALRLHRLSQSMGRSSRWDSPVLIEPSGSNEIRSSVKVEDDEISFVAKGSITEPISFNPSYLCSIFAGTNVDNLFGQGGLKPWGLKEDAPEIGPGVTRTRVLMPVRVS